MFARESVLKDDLFKLRDAVDQHYADKNEHPIVAGRSLVSSGYLARAAQGSDHERRLLVDDRPFDPDPGQSHGRAGHLRREKRVRAHRTRRHEILGVVRGPLPGPELQTDGDRGVAGCSCCRSCRSTVTVTV